MRQEPTRAFSIRDEKEYQIRQVLTEVYEALNEKGYNPVNQIVGYILSEDLHHHLQQCQKPDPENRPGRTAPDSGAFLPERQVIFP